MYSQRWHSRAILITRTFTLSGVYFSEFLSGRCQAVRTAKKYYILKKLKGVYNQGDPPLPIPNREVKPLSADGTAERWESRLAPNFERESCYVVTLSFFVCLLLNACFIKY